MRIALLISLTVAALPAAADTLPPNVAGNYTVVPINYPGGVITNPLGINSQRVIVGSYVDPFTEADHAFLWRDGNYYNIDYNGADLGAFGDGASTINDQGDILGTYFDTNGNEHGFLATLAPGCTDIAAPNCRTYQTFDVPGVQFPPNIEFEFGTGLGTAPIGINNNGDISGMYAAGDYSAGFLLTGGIGGTFTSYSNPNGDNTSVVVPDGNGGFVTVGLGTKFFSLANNGAIAGDYLTLDGLTHGFLLNGNVATPINVPGSGGTFGVQVNGINSYNQAVGVFGDSVDTLHGFIYDNGTYSSFDLPGQLTELHVISDRGDMTGANILDLNNPFTYSGFVVFAPEPSTVWLGFAGLTLAALLRQKRFADKKA